MDIQYANHKTLWWDLKIILMTVPVLMVQMMETRLVKKRSSRPGQPKAGYANSVPGSYSHTRAPLAGAVHAAGEGDEAWVRKEAKLNI
jgi:hypothetical protein